jgi:hypothetical protein
LACRLTPSIIAQRAPVTNTASSGSTRLPMRSILRPAPLPIAVRLVLLDGKTQVIE